MDGLKMARALAVRYHRSFGNQVYRYRLWLLRNLGYNPHSAHIFEEIALSQLHCYVADELAEKFRKKADSAHLPVSKYLALLVKREVETQWPEHYFDCFGGWQGDPPERPEQGDFEKRVDFD